MVRFHRGHADDVVRITTAPVNPQDEVDQRMRRYAISMTIRTVCFVSAMIAGLVFDITWLMWTLFIASLFLPFVAVVMANSASPRIPGADLDGIRHDEIEGPRP